MKKNLQKYYKVLRETSSIQNELFHLHMLLSSQELLVIVVSRKIGCAVFRNKIKRRIRHIIRENKTPHYSLMFRVQREIKYATFNTLKKNILYSVKIKLQQAIVLN